MNLRRIGTGLGYSITDPLPSPPVFELIAVCGGVSPAEMWEVFNMGCGLSRWCRRSRPARRSSCCRSFHPGTAVIGTLTDRDNEVELPGLDIRATSSDESLIQA